jgi:hypothetical protein
VQKRKDTYQIREEVVRWVFTQIFENIQPNRVGVDEVGEDGNAKTDVDVTGKEGLACNNAMRGLNNNSRYEHTTGENIEEVDIKVKGDANVNKAPLDLGLSRAQRAIRATGSSKGRRRQNEWDER